MTKRPLRDYCIAEFENIETVLSELLNLVGDGKISYTNVELAAMATFLHNFYNGVENILKRILTHQSAAILDSPTWHKDLLRTARDKKVIGEHLYEGLSVYLSFRHFFIHSYSFALRWHELKPLVNNLKETFGALKDAVEKYLDRIE